MATSLHQQLKSHYTQDVRQHEVSLDDFRIDAIDESGRLIEIQCASLGAIRTKIRRLLKDHDVVVVKPLASRKQIVRRESPDGDAISCRYSPTRQTLANIFLDLVHFSRVFPHPRLRLDILLTQQREIRLPPTEKSSWRRKYSVHDRELITVDQHFQFSTPRDIWDALNPELPDAFTTADLAEAIATPRWLAQKAAYCFREMGLLQLHSKDGNSLVYRLATPAVVAARKRKSSVSKSRRPA
ncbi:MAG: hypothetical protein KDA91_13920 [Planctomycetaceae bacterium]|nr:hypothetical protein [Planctomycetaceae bacterium]